MKNHHAWGGLALLLAASTVAVVGPPFQTDDREPIDYKNYEFYTFDRHRGAGGGVQLGRAAERSPPHLEPRSIASVLRECFENFR
jgi:hypothetical protein